MSSDCNEHGGEGVLYTKVLRLIFPQGVYFTVEPSGKTRALKAELSNWDIGISLSTS